MTAHGQSVEALLDDLWLDLADLVRLSGVDEPWLLEHLQRGLLVTHAPPADTRPRFDAADLRRVRRIACLERDFDAVPELAALVADLQDEIERLRARLRRAGLG